MLFLVLGLVIGISTVVTLLSITESMTKNIEERLNQFGANIIVVPKSENLSLNYGGIDVGGVNYKVREFDQKRLLEIKTIKNSKNLAIVAPKVLGPVQINDKTILLMGVIFEEELALKTWWQKQGGTYPEKENEVMLGSQVAMLLGFKSGDIIHISDQPFTITTILKQTGASEDNAIIASLGASQAILGKQGKISMVEISAFCQGCPITELTLQIAEKFPDGKVTAMKQVVMSKMQSIEMFKSFSLGISVIVIFIGSLLVLVTMMGSVNERTREIGIFRAIGFRRGHVMQVILLEALLLGIIGGIIGFTLGNLIAYSVIPLVMKDSVFVGINTNLGIVSILMAVALSLLASLYPAFKASNMDPSEALRAL
ncbi:MAG: FtsX-like permease family protein [Desulfobacteraceae bacterium]|nr:FtsX-like permease family protein [Desulfobacteraceae bacterium]